MTRCAFVIHPHSFAFLERYLRSLSPNYRPRRKALMKKILEWTPVHQQGEATRIGSTSAGAVEVVMINCSLLPEQWVTLPEDFVLQRVVEACELGAELGAEIFGLSAFTSIVGEQGTKVAERVGKPVTSGNTFTVHTVIADVEIAARALGLDLSNATVTILGASGDIGSACTRILADRVAKLVLCARTLDNLESLGAKIARQHSVDISLERRARDAVVGADVVISATSAISSVIDADQLKPGAIVCDVGYPRHISGALLEKRPDVLAFEGGVVCPPEPFEPGFETGFPPGTIPACLAETALLTLEKRFESFSMGRGAIMPQKVDEIAAIAQRHGFTLDRLRCGNFVYGDEEIERIRVAAAHPEGARRDGQLMPRSVADYPVT